MPAEAATVRVRAREGGVAEVRALGPAGSEITIALEAPVVPEGQLLAEEPVWRFGAVVGEEVVVGAVDDPPS